MKLWYDRRAKDPTYWIQYGYRNGSKVTTTNVKKIGKHSELLGITSDPLTYAKQQVEIYNQENAKEKVEHDTEMMPIDYNAPLKESKEIFSTSVHQNVGYFFLQSIYSSLALPDFFQKIQMEYKAQFDCNEINRFLTFARVIKPESKLATVHSLDNYFEQPSFTDQQAYRFMDILYDNYSQYLEWLFQYRTRIAPIDNSVFYYDCTNFYFETEEEDEDYIDDVTGEYIKGMRKYGASKEHRPNPIVEMGLFTDANAIPLTMCITSGSDNEQTTAIPLEKQVVKMVEGKKFIYCADAGLGSANIRKFNDMGGRAFVVTQSIKKLSEPLQAAVFNDFEYKLLSSNRPISIKTMKEFDKKDPDNLDLYNDFAYKVINADRAVDVGLMEEKKYKNGKVVMVKSKAELKQRVIVTFSRKMMEYQRHIRKRQVDRAKDLLETSNVEDLKRSPNDVRRFIKRKSVGKNGEPAKDYYEINQDLIDEEAKYDGYYATATNLLNDSPKDILAITKQRNVIEDCFRALKSDFKSRPAFHHLPKRIKAHFLICYTALLFYRLMEYKLNQNGTHFTRSQILTTLRNMNVKNNSDLYYSALYTESEVSKALCEIYNLPLNTENYRPTKLRKMIKALKKSAPAKKPRKNQNNLG